MKSLNSQEPRLSQGKTSGHYINPIWIEYKLLCAVVLVDFADLSQARRRCAIHSAETDRDHVPKAPPASLETTGVPVPDLKHIKPLKVAVDVSTRMKNGQVPNESLKLQLYFRSTPMLLLDVFLLVGRRRIWSELRVGKILTQPITP